MACPQVAQLHTPRASGQQLPVSGQRNLAPGSERSCFQLMPPLVSEMNNSSTTNEVTTTDDSSTPSSATSDHKKYIFVKVTLLLDSAHLVTAITLLQYPPGN